MEWRWTRAAAVLVAMVTCAAVHADAPTKIRLLSISFEVPFAVDVEGTGTEDIFAMVTKQCASQCPPVVMAWECRFDAEPTCADLNATPPRDACAEVEPTSIAHSATLRETRWNCPPAESSDGTWQTGFSVFDVPKGRLVVAYLGAMSDPAPAALFDFVAKSLRAQRAR